MSKLVLSKLALFVLHDGICGSFHNKATINASALLCVLWQNLDEDSFDMLYKNDCWAAISGPIWTTNVSYERKIYMLSYTYNNFMICLFDFEKFSIESRFPFFLTHTVQCVPEKRNPINQVNFSENYNDLSKKVYIVTKFNSSSFFWHKIQDVLSMHGRAQTISNGDVKIDLRRIGS